MRRIGIAVFLLLAVATGRGGAGEAPPEAAVVRTSRTIAKALPAPGEEESFRFAIFGDRTGGPADGIEILRRAVRDANLLAPDFVMTVGDLVEGYNERAEWIAQATEYRGVMAELRMPWYPVAGNHDVNWRGGEAPPGHHEADYEEHFGPLWYWFRHRNAAFVALYSDEGDRKRNLKGHRGEALTRFSEEQKEWLAETLAETRGLDHVFVFLHHPRWIPGRYPGNDWDEIHEMLVAAGNVTAVFAGHLHRIRHEGVRDGIRYETLSGSGAGMPMDAPGTGWRQHLNLVTVRKDGISVAAIPVAAVFDPRELTPDHLEVVDRVASAPFAVDGEAILLAEDGAGEGEIRVRFENPSARPVHVVLELARPAGGFTLHPERVVARVEPGGRLERTFDLRRGGHDWNEMVAPRIALTPTIGDGPVLAALPARYARVRLQPPAMPASPAGGPDLAAFFDGRSALLVEDVALPLPAAAMTVEAWVRPDALDGLQSVAGKTQRSEFGLYLEHGRPVFLLHAGGDYARAEAETPVARRRWVHLAGVHDGKEIRLYVDGRLAARADASGDRTGNDLPLVIGGEPDRSGSPDLPFRGAVDDLRLSRTARYRGPAFEPQAKPSADEMTVLLLTMNGRRGPFLRDQSAAGSWAAEFGVVGYELRSPEEGGTRR